MWWRTRKRAYPAIRELLSHFFVVDYFHPSVMHDILILAVEVLNCAGAKCYRQNYSPFFVVLGMISVQRPHTSIGGKNLCRIHVFLLREYHLLLGPNSKIYLDPVSWPSPFKLQEPLLVILHNTFSPELTSGRMRGFMRWRRPSSSPTLPASGRTARSRNQVDHFIFLKSLLRSNF